MFFARFALPLQHEMWNTPFRTVQTHQAGTVPQQADGHACRQRCFLVAPQLRGPNLLWVWLKGLHWSRRMKHAAYLLNPFELEAYRHMHDLGYAERHADGTDEWRKYLKMSFEERRNIYNEIFGK